MSFGAGLKDTVDVKRLTENADGRGGIDETGTPTSVVASWRCRIMPYYAEHRQATFEAFGVVAEKLRRVTGEYNASIAVNDYLEDSDGNTFTIVSVETQSGLTETHHLTLVVRVDQ